MARGFFICKMQGEKNGARPDLGRALYFTSGQQGLDGVHDGLQVLARDEERTAAIQNGDAGGAVVAVDHQLDLREVLGIPVESESYLFAKSSADTLGAAGGAQSLQLLKYVREVCLLAVKAEGLVVEGRAFLVRLFRQLHVHAVGLAAELDVKARGLVPVEQDDVLGQQRGGVGVEQTVADAGVYEVYHLRARDARIAAAVRGVGAELKVEGLFLLARFVDRLAVLVRLVGLYLSMGVVTRSARTRRARLKPSSLGTMTSSSRS